MPPALADVQRGQQARMEPPGPKTTCFVVAQAVGPTASFPAISREDFMAVARVTELISASKKSFEDAIQVGITRAVQTLKNVEGVWVANQKCVIKDGKIDEYRVNLKVTFILQE
jgi:flavin-binding protein dodecin